MDIAWIGHLPVEESEPVFASPSSKYCTNAGKQKLKFHNAHSFETVSTVEYKKLFRKIYQKQKTAMMATRIGFFTFFKLGWSNKVDRTP